MYKCSTLAPHCRRRQPALLPAEGSAGEKVRASPGGPQYALAPPPLRDLGVMAGEEHLRPRPAPELGGPRVLRVLQQPLGMRLLGQRGLRPQDARQPPRHRFDDDHGGQLAAGEDVVADTYLIVDQVLAHSLVHPLVVAADKDEAGLPREIDRDLLVEEPSLGGEKDDPSLRRIKGCHPLNRFEERLGLYQHTRPPATRVVNYHLQPVPAP